MQAQQKQARKAEPSRGTQGLTCAAVGLESFGSATM